MKKGTKDSVSIEKSDELYFTIGDAAHQVGVAQATIRNWEKQGLVNPKRTDGGYRVFSQSDIHLLKSIRQMRREGNIGIGTLQSIYGEDSQSAWHRPPKKDVPEGSRKKDISDRIRACRIEKGYMIREVAKAVGMSPSYLSKIENGQANASYKMLQKLSEFYGIDFVGEDSPADVQKAELVRKGEGSTLSVGNNGITIEAVSGGHSLISVMIYSVKPGCGRKKSASHKGEEFVHVIRGRVSFTVAGDDYSLKAGDSLSFKSEELHSWYNSGSTPATLMWTYCPISV